MNNGVELLHNIMDLTVHHQLPHSTLAPTPAIQSKNDPTGTPTPTSASQQGHFVLYFGEITIYRLGSRPSEWVSTSVLFTRAAWITLRS